MKLFSILVLTSFLTANMVSAQTKSLFIGGHEDVPFGIAVGYVSKNWRTNFKGKVFWEDLCVSNVISMLSK